MSWTEGWHFCPADALLGNEDGRLIVVGETLTVDGPLELCAWGLHASCKAWDALNYAPDPSRLCRVRLGGEIIYDIDQAAATERACLAMLPARETAVLLRRWAIWCARQVEHLLTDPRSRRAIDVAEAWCDGTATDADLKAAEDAAWAAAEAAAGDATVRAARDAAWNARAAQRQQLETMCLEAINAAPARGY